MEKRPADHPLTGPVMSFDHLKRPWDRLPGHKLKPSRANLLVQNSKPHLSMKQTYILAIDVAKHKVRAALSGVDERLLFEKDLPVSAGGLRELLVRLREHVAEREGLLVLWLGQRVASSLVLCSLLFGVPELFLQRLGGFKELVSGNALAKGLAPKTRP